MLKGKKRKRKIETVSTQKWNKRAKDRMKDRQEGRQRQAEEEVNEAIRRNRELND